MHIPYSRACNTGLWDPVYIQLLRILPDHVKTELNICTLLLLYPHRVLCALFHFPYYLSPSDIHQNYIIPLGGPLPSTDLRFVVGMTHRKRITFTACGACTLRFVFVSLRLV